MPLPEDGHTLAEIARQVADFRNEFRSTVGTLVRQDVYQAQQETLRAQLAAIEAAHSRDMAAAEAVRARDVALLQGQIATLEADKRQNRGLIFGAFASAAVALLLGFFRGGS